MDDHRDFDDENDVTYGQFQVRDDIKVAGMDELLRQMTGLNAIVEVLSSTIKTKDMLIDQLTQETARMKGEVDRLTKTVANLTEPKERDVDEDFKRAMLKQYSSGPFTAPKKPPSPLRGIMGPKIFIDEEGPKSIGDLYGHPSEDMHRLMIKELAKRDAKKIEKQMMAEKAKAFELGSAGMDEPSNSNLPEPTPSELAAQGRSPFYLSPVMILSRRAS